MSEFKFEMSPAEVKAGKVRFELKNAGAVEHSFIIEGVGKGTEQIRPGQETTLEVEFAPRHVHGDLRRGRPQRSRHDDGTRGQVILVEQFTRGCTP